MGFSLGSAFKKFTIPGLLGAFDGNDGKDPGNLIPGTPGYQNLQNEAAAQNDAGLQSAVSNYGSGGMSLQDALSGQSGPKAGQLADQLALDPRTGTKMATDQVQSNPMLAGMFGKGGMQDQLLNEQKDLSQKGWSMQPQDNEAFGQASDNIARMSGQSENSLSQALAARGMASSANGVAGAAFSGAEGNKFEALANQQRAIAQQRMDMNLQRLQNTRQMAMQMGQQGANDIQNQYTRNLQGVQEKQQVNKDSVAAAGDAQNQTNNQLMAKDATQSQGALPGMLGAAGMALGAQGGPQGAAMGGSLGNSLGKSISAR